MSSVSMSSAASSGRLSSTSRPHGPCRSIGGEWRGVSERTFGQAGEHRVRTSGEASQSAATEREPVWVIDVMSTPVAHGAPACVEHDPELFFAETPAGVEQAKSVCQTCPVQQACLAMAQRRGEPHGVWGGELFVAGEVVERKRPRGRPRKQPLIAA